MIHYLLSVIFLQDEGPDSDSNSGSGSGSGSSSGDDEDDYPDGSFLCSKSTKCILELSLCDGVNDCGNWEDESVSVCGGK